MAGYHVSKIEKGVLGEVSKIEEEFLEFRDAQSQHCKIMAMIELSDMYGSIEHFMRKHQNDIYKAPFDLSHVTVNDESFTYMFNRFKMNPFNDIAIIQLLQFIDAYVKTFYNITLEDLKIMHAITERAFISHERV